MTDLVVVSLEAWDDVWRRNQHLVAGLLRTHAVARVLFVEPAADPVHALRSRARPRTGTGLRRITDVPEIDGDRLWGYQPTKWLPRRLDSGIDARWSTGVTATVRELGFSNPLLWVNDPRGAELLDTGWPSLYDITDDWLAADRPTAELERLRRQEGELLARCEQVIVCSRALQHSKSGSGKVTLVPNAVDLEPYRIHQPRPKDLPSGPVAMYLGTVHRDRIDVDLCIATAQRLASMSAGVLILVGPAPLPSSDLDALRAVGVSVLGARPSVDVPAYLQHADVLLVPHVLTEFTASLDPIKAYEYRAARRPVVSTPVPGFAGSPDPLVRAVPAAAFPEVVAERAAAPVPWSSELPDDIPTWSQRVVEMAAVLDRVAGASP